MKNLVAERKWHTTWFWSQGEGRTGEAAGEVEPDHTGLCQGLFRMAEEGFSCVL